MTYLGTLPVRSQHHFAATESELNHLVNALAFFHAVFDPNRVEPILAIVNEWQDVANDTHLPSIDALATKLAAASRP
jgi:hypothetical protein